MRAVWTEVAPAPGGSCRPPAHLAPHAGRSQHCRLAFEEQTSFYVRGGGEGAGGSGLSPAPRARQGGFSTGLPGQGRSTCASPVVPGREVQCHSGGMSLGPGLVGSRVAGSELVLQLRFPGPLVSLTFQGRLRWPPDVTLLRPWPTRWGHTCRREPHAVWRTVAVSLCRAQGARLPSAGDGGRACGECGKGAGCRLGGPGADAQ